MEVIVRCLLELVAWYSEEKYCHNEKYGNDGQGIVGVGRMVSPSGSLSVEGRGGYGIGMCNLRLSFRKGGYVGNLQWDIMTKSPTEWANIYGYEVLVMGNIIFIKGWYKVHRDKLSYSGGVIWKDHMI